MASIVDFAFNSELPLQTVCVNMAPWFRGKDVANILAYENSQKALRDHVDSEDRLRLENLRVNESSPLSYNEKNTIYVNESGLYSLILRSNKPEAKIFKRWLTSHVLPTIRKEGFNQLGLLTEASLHRKVVRFIRDHLPVALLAPTLGELQDTSVKRLDAYHKGYRRGSPDILILNKHIRYTGFAVEFKNPTGTGIVSADQGIALAEFAAAGFKTLVSCDYNTIIVELMKYFADVRLHCPCCPKVFRTSATVQRHLARFHRV